jgi:menaquinone-specific isochorismate synthase
MSQLILSPWELQPSTQQTDLLEWLKAESLFPKIYWKRSHECAGVGSAQGSLFYAEAFSQKAHADATWKEFPKKLSFQPEKLLVQASSSSRCSATFKKPIQRIDSPSQDGWKKTVQQALKEIDAGDFEKVVLARKTTFTFDEPIDIFPILEKFRENCGERILFALQLSPDTAFIGATPETLFQREKRTLVTHALAGTRKRGKNPEEDLLFRKELLSSKKDLRECLAVKKFLIQKLTPLCEQLSFSDAGSVKQNPFLQHLCFPFVGKLKEDILDTHILQALHPTPAVAGYPQKEALEFIQAHETFDRGYYAGPIGWMSDEQTDLTVAIRSALICGNQMHLFAATGIVKDSNYLKEWEELDAKIAPFISLWM